MAKEKVLREFIFTGTVEYSGVQFFVRAEDKEGALAKAADGDWWDFETTCAEPVNWKLDPKTIQPND